MVEIFVQVMVAGLGVLSIYLVTAKTATVRRYAAVCGLCAEPFWFWTSVINEQWGILFLSIVYGVRWGQVLYRDWFGKGNVYEDVVD